jgi:murein L,D-transpeptidase YafK
MAFHADPVPEALALDRASCTLLAVQLCRGICVLKRALLIIGLISVSGCAQPPITYPLAPKSVPSATVQSGKADRVVVNKGARELMLIRGGQVIRTYPVALGPNPIGHKIMEGDGRTPEGTYVLDWRNPNSRFHRSIHVSYPDQADRLLASKLGVSPGGMIMIHGEASYLRFGGGALRDWTEGCIAVSNGAMDEIWALVDDGTPIVINP